MVRYWGLTFVMACDFSDARLSSTAQQLILPKISGGQWADIRFFSSGATAQVSQITVTFFSFTVTVLAEGRPRLHLCQARWRAWLVASLLWMDPRKLGNPSFSSEKTHPFFRWNFQHALLGGLGAWRVFNMYYRYTSRVYGMLKPWIAQIAWKERPPRFFIR